MEGVEEREGKIGPKRGRKGVRGGVEERGGCRSPKGVQEEGMGGRCRGQRRVNKPKERTEGGNEAKV